MPRSPANKPWPSDIFSEHGYEAARVADISALAPVIGETTEVFHPEGELFAFSHQASCVKQLT
jgi:hypothetical protein